MPFHVVTDAPAAADGPLRIVAVEPNRLITSTGEEFVITSEKCQALAEQLCQEQVPVTMQTWWTVKHGWEVVELHRVGTRATELTDRKTEVF